MFDIAWSELLLIAIVALIFIGPKELPQVMYRVAQAISKLRNQADDFRRQFEESARDAGFEDLKKNLNDFRQLNPANQLRESIDKALSMDPINQASPSIGASQPDLKPDETTEKANLSASESSAPEPQILQHEAKPEQIALEPQQQNGVVSGEKHTQTAEIADDVYWPAAPNLSKDYSHDVKEANAKPKPPSHANGSGSDTEPHSPVFGS